MMSAERPKLKVPLTRKKMQASLVFLMLQPVLRIRIRRIHMLLGLPDPHPDQLVKDMDPDPTIIKQK